MEGQVAPAMAAGLTDRWWMFNERVLVEWDLPAGGFFCAGEMMQYILLIQGNVTSACTSEEWKNFFADVRESGVFKGGSEIGKRMVIGDATTAKSSDHIVAYMRFDSDDKQQLLNLLNKHPVITHGGSAELCEMPETL